MSMSPHGANIWCLHTLQAEGLVGSLTARTTPCVRGTTSAALTRLHSELLPSAQVRWPLQFNQRTAFMMTMDGSSFDRI